MKKIIFSLICILLLCGCSVDEKDEFENYKHYQLKSSDIVSYSFNLGYNNNVTYALADISEGEGFTTGLFYQIGDNGYILLDEIESCGDENAHEDVAHNYFVNDKLYIVRCLGALIFEYTLNGKDIQKKELKFDESLIINELEEDGHPHYLETHRIEKVDANYIYFNANIHNGSSVNVKCSLKEYKCELNK